MPTICTWNTQGDPTTKDTKIPLLVDLFDKYDVLLLQECGKMSKINRLIGPHYLKLSPQAGALNSRCSTCILSKKRFTATQKFLQSGTGRCAIIGIFDFTPIKIMTMHAASGIGASDVIPFLKKQTPPYILGADMNEDFTCLTGHYTTTTRRLQIDPRCEVEAYISAPQTFTHPGSRSILDYFIYSPGLTCSETRTYHMQGKSDHVPVCTTVDFAYRGP